MFSFLAFNQLGSSHHSKTRLVSFNYPTAAVAANDLGGIEIAFQKIALTIGLETISFSKNAKVIIMAAGEGKANVVRAAIEDDIDVSRPCSILQTLPNARFYLTHGAASKLTNRQYIEITKISNNCLNWIYNYLSGNIYDENGSIYLIQPPKEYKLLESCLYNTSIHIKKPG